MQDCFLTALKDKTVILVTHQVEFLTGADTILVKALESLMQLNVGLTMFMLKLFLSRHPFQVMEGGQITESGRYAELLTPGTVFEQLVNAHKVAVKELVTSDEKCNINDDQLELSYKSSPTKEISKNEISDEGLPVDQLTKEEEREIGDVGWKPILDYLHVSQGSLLFSLSILSYIAFGALQAGSSYWLAIGIRIPTVTNGILVGVYTGISTFSIPFVYLRNLFSAYLGLKASKAFFTGINNSVFKAPMLFFDSTPVGRIFTRVR